MASDTGSGGSVYNTSKGGYYGGQFISYALDSNVRAQLMDDRWVTSFGGTTIPTTMYYSFPTQTSDYSSVAGYPDSASVDVYKVATVFQQQAAIAGFGLVASYTNVKFEKVTSGLASDATFRIAGITGPLSSHAWFPPNTGPYVASDSRVAGDVWLNTNGEVASANFYGTDEFLTVIHELGHAFGLKHGHDGGYNGALAPAVNDSEFSIMTYASYMGADPSVVTGSAEGSSAQSYMMYDIAALQALYGANLSKSEETWTYTWDAGSGQQYINNGTTNAAAPFTGVTAGNKIFSTIWTQGAVATYDLSNFSEDQVDDMRPGRWMTFSRAQLADLNSAAAPGTVQYQAQGNIYNSLLYYGGYESEITGVVTGSGNDIVTGNDLDNVISTNDGNDTLIGGPGSDRLYGGAGNDILIGGVAGSSAPNQLWGGDGNDTASYVGVAGVVYANLADGFGLIDGSRADVYNSIENLTAGGGPATLIGDDNVNVLTGGAANDALYGQGGDDILIGGGVTAGGTNQLWGGGGSDTASYAGTSGRVTADLRAQAGYVNGVLFDQMNSIENLIGGSAADTLIGTNGANRLTGGGGADALYGMGGADIFTYLAYGDSNLLAGYDTIEDFVSGTSRLDLKAFTTDASHVSIVSDAQTTSLYLMMVAGAFNAATDLAISLVGANAINNGDIIF
jgi:Ca2+-binding RTX toxin-like protein